jgi:hypothetical protein
MFFPQFHFIFIHTYSSHSGYIKHMTPTYTALTEEYAICLYTNAENPCPRPEHGEASPSPASLYMLMINVCGVGTIAAFFFGAMADLRCFWCRVSVNFFFKILFHYFSLLSTTEM